MRSNCATIPLNVIYTAAVEKHWLGTAWDGDER